MRNSKGITLIALIITIIVMLILVGVTVNVAMQGGLFGTAREASSETIRQAEKDQLISAVLGGLQTGGTFDITKATLPAGAKWITSKTDDTPASPTPGSGNWVMTDSGNKFYVDKDGNVLDDEPTSSGWVYLEENNEKVLMYQGTESIISLTETISNVAKYVEEEVGTDDEGNPITEMVLKGYEDFNITNTNLFVSFYNNTNIQEVNFNGYNVKLAGECFCGCTNLTSVTLTGITSIPFFAFEDCPSLTSIEIPDSIESIDSHAFTACTNLTQITINKANGSISGEPWGAPNATVTWQQ